MIETRSISCPYCGEEFDTTIDCSAGDQQYIEDCHVCCRPIEFSIQVDSNGDLKGVDTRSGDE